MKKLAAISALVAIAIVLLGILGSYTEIEVLAAALVPGLLANAALAPKGQFAPDGIWGYLVGFGSAFIAWFALIFFLAVTCRLGWHYTHKRLHEGEEA